MSYDAIKIGAYAGDGLGDPLRTAGGKINTMFSELYAASLSLSPDQSTLSSEKNLLVRTLEVEKYFIQTGIGEANLALGADSLNVDNFLGSHSTAIGHQANKSATTSANNVAIGSWSLYYNTIGSKNVVIGKEALYNSVASAESVAIGYQAGISSQGNQNTFIGAFSKPLAAADDNSIVIGYGAIGKGPNTVVIGNAQTTDNYFYGNLIIPGVISASGYNDANWNAAFDYSQIGHQVLSEKGQANGYVPLDSGAKIDSSYLPDYILGQVVYQGTWNANTNTPSLPSAIESKGYYYVVDTAGTYNTIDFQVGDWVISNGVDWQKVDNTDAVTGFNSRLGNIIPLEGDYSSFFYTKTLLDGGQLDSRYYTETETNNFFSGGTTIGGYNKSNWDSAYGWGNHALAGYLTSETDTLQSVTNREAITSSVITLSGAAPNAEDDINSINFYNTISGLNLARITVKRTTGGTNYGSIILSTASSGALSEAVRIDSSKNIIVVGTISASGYNDANWNSAYNWGDWSVGVDTAFVNALNVDADTLDGLDSTAFSLASHNHDNRYYTETELDNIFSGATAIGGYNKSNWDSAYSYTQIGHQVLSEKGQANGYVPLDSGAKIAEAYLPDSILGQVEYQGTWNAATNSPALSTLTTPKGHYYIVSAAGTFDSIDYAVGDWIISDGTSWNKVDNTDAVTTFNGRIGSIVPIATDYDSFFYTKTLLDAGQLDNRYYTETETNNFFSGGTAIGGYNKSNWDTAYSYSQISHLPLTGGSLSGGLSIIDISAPDTTAASLIIEGRRDGGANVLALRARDASAPSLGIPNGQGAVMRWQGFNGTSFENMGYIFVGADGQAVGIGDAPSFMAFGVSADGSSSPTEAIRIDSFRRIGIGTSSPDRELDLENATDNAIMSIVSGTTNVSGLVLGDTADDDRGGMLYNNTNDYLYFLSNAVEGMRLTSTGVLHVLDGISGYSTTLSDKRLKDDVITIEDALGITKQMRGASWIWNAGSKKGQVSFGHIADEMLKVVPEIVKEMEMPFIDDSGELYKTIESEQILGIHTEAIKQLADEKDRQILDLQRQIDELKKLIL